MSSRRVLRAASAIREAVSMAILREMKDPRVRNVTVTYVEVTPDMRTAKIHVSVMGSAAEQQLSLRGLRSAAGYLQSKVAERVDTRYIPKLEFEIDRGVKNSLEVARILDEELGADRDSLAAGEAKTEGQTPVPRDTTTGIMEDVPQLPADSYPADSSPADSSPGHQDQVENGPDPAEPKDF